MLLSRNLLQSTKEQFGIWLIRDLSKFNATAKKTYQAMAFGKCVVKVNPNQILDINKEKNWAHGQKL